MIITTQDYGQFLINGVNNYTGTYFAKIVEGLEHDSVWRYLNGAKLLSKVIWKIVSEDIILQDKCLNRLLANTPIEGERFFY